MFKKIPIRFVLMGIYCCCAKALFCWFNVKVRMSNASTIVSFVSASTCSFICFLCISSIYSIGSKFFEFLSDPLGFIVDFFKNTIGAKDSYTNGAGKPLECTGDYTKRGLVCYENCPEGWVSDGTHGCYEPCPSGFNAAGPAACTKPESYGRGVGYPWQFGDSLDLNKATERCQKDNPQGCEKNGEIMYPKCKPGFHNVGCCVCSPDCPSGWNDYGVGCTPPGKNVGSKPIDACEDGYEQDPTGLLCYPKCEDKEGFSYKMAGPICWQDAPI